MKKTVVNEKIAVSGETVSHSLPVLSQHHLPAISDTKIAENNVENKMSSLVESGLFIGFI